MTRQETIVGLKEYFDIQELVCKHVFNRFGEGAWKLFRTDLLDTLWLLRINILNVPLYVNDWQVNGLLNQRGFRCNLCQIVIDNTNNGVLYTSAHMLGAGLDFNAKGMSADATREIIVHHADALPNPIRLEVGSKISWVHLDVLDNGTGNKITYFSE